MQVALLIKFLIAIGAAVLLGNGSVVLVNHMPMQWFEPELHIEDDGRQRIPSTPWKYIFMGFFGISGVYLSLTASARYEIAVLLMLFVVLLMAICDQRFRVVPNQLQLLLILTAIGFVAYNENWWEPAAGAGIGLALGLSELGLGMLIYKRAAIGGADIKFFVCMGLIAGRSGIVAIFVLTTLLFAAESVYMLATRRIKRNEGLALMPAAFLGTTIYFLFLYNTLDAIIL